ncbi:hypothetical protein SprV_0100315600 [Sparganum proliferum]
MRRSEFGVVMLSVIASAGLALMGIILSAFLRPNASTYTTWNEFYAEVSERISGDFIMQQLSFFSGWHVHEAGSVPNTLLAARIASDWRRWNWPIVRLVNFSVRLPQGPAISGSWNRIALVNATTNKTLHVMKNFVNVNVTDQRHADNVTCTSGIFPGRPGDNCTNYRFPAYIGYSRPGAALGRPVFVNYGRTSDFRTFLKSHPGADDLCSRDVIVVVRHGWTALPSKLRALVDFCESIRPPECSAQQCLPAAMLVYPDPADVVPPSGAIFPKGIGLPGDAPVLRTASMAQLGGGDAQTPFLPAIEEVYKTEDFENATLTPIPVQPIGYDDAQKIFQTMTGPPVPRDWSPCMPRFLGPSGSAKVDLVVENVIPQNISTITNVLGVIPGSSNEADQYIIFGNHRDAWVQGASDPGSGTAILQAVASALGAAHYRGWRPLRTVILASWDAEEISLIGSTETTELFREELNHRAVIYINQDCPIKGNATFNGRTDQLLADALLASAAEVYLDPPGNRSLLDYWRELQGKPPGDLPDTTPPLGSTDNVPFQYKLGVPSMYPEFRPAYPMFDAPSYHSEYDSVDMAVKLTDPPSTTGELLPLHRLLAKLSLNLIFRFSSSALLPISASTLASSLNRSWVEFEQFANSQILDIREHGIKFDYVSSKIARLIDSARSFESWALQTENKNPDNELAQRLASLPVAAAADENASVDNRWCQLRDTVQSTALAVLRHARRQHQDWFDDNDAAVSNLLAEKNCLHKAYVTRPTDDNEAAFYHSHRLVQQPLREMQDAQTARKAEEIQGYADRNEWKNFFSPIKAVCGPQTKATAPLVNANGCALLTGKTQILQRWAEHFGSLLNRPSIISDGTRHGQWIRSRDVRTDQQSEAGLRPRAYPLHSHVLCHADGRLP